MVGSLTDQGNVDRLAETVAARFRYVAAWGTWLHYDSGCWHVTNAEPELRQAYLLMLAEFCRGAVDPRHAAQFWDRCLAASCQDWCLNLASRDVRFRAEPEQFDRTESILTPDGMVDPETGEVSDGSSQYAVTKSSRVNPFLLDEATFSAASKRLLVPSEILAKYSTRTCACRYLGPRILARSDARITDLGDWLEELRSLLGGYVCSLSFSEWQRWPHALSPENALMLSGARLVFLDSPERWQRFPQESFKRLLLRETVQWTGRDRQTHLLRMPRCFVLTGPVFAAEYFDPHLLELIEQVPCLQERAQ